jgi:UDP-glucose 4-epimerase
MTEDHPQRPINPYGQSKWMVEKLLIDFGRAYGLPSVIFRYFNAAGADPDGDLGEDHTPETHLIPLMLDAIDGKRAALTVFGSDYPTPDGTCIRDYVHVCDLVDAHVLGLRWLQAGKGSRIFCLGSGQGFSVREVIEASRAVTNRDVPIIEGTRRAGDATSLVCGSTRAVKELGWKPARSTLQQMITDALRWSRQAPYAK